MQVLLTTTRNWHLAHTGRAFSNRAALAGLWMGDKNSTGIPPEKYRRCWAFHLVMKPFYHLAPQVWEERFAYYAASLYDVWVRKLLASPTRPQFNVAQSIIGLCQEPFRFASRMGALRVVDCPNTHPTTLYGFWQRECDLWCPGEKVPIPRWMFAQMNRDLKQADVIIVQSQFSKESMVLNGIPANRVFVNPMGVDVTIFKKRGEPPSTPRFVCVATICLRKGHQYLFRAFEIVRKRLPNAELMCVGPYKSDFRREREKWEGRFTHIPHLPHEQVAELLRRCTAFVFPSQEEGIARAQVEALAAGLPVIGTHEGGSTTLIKDGQEGFIVCGQDPESIAGAMIKVASDPELNRKMGAAAFEKGSVRNTWQDYGDRLLQHYRCLTAERAPT